MYQYGVISKKVKGCYLGSTWVKYRKCIRFWWKLSQSVCLVI